MEARQVQLVERAEECIYGLEMETRDARLHRDIPELTRRYRACTGRNARRALSLYVLTRDYAPESGRSTLFIGGRLPGEGLQALRLPGGLYAKLEIRPRFQFLWGAATGSAKRWFYTRWLPQSGFEARNLEFELHAARALERRPSAELYFALKRKEE